MARVRTTHEVDPAIIDDNAQSPEIAIFAKTLNRLMVEKHVHQDDMAQAVGISTGSISSYRNGKKEPRLSMIAKMANYLGVDCHYLMTGIQAKNYICSNELGLSEKALNTLNAADSDELDFISFLIENRISSNISVKAYGCAIDKSLIMALDKKYSTVGMHRDDVHKMIRESADVRNAFNEVKRLQERVDTRLWRCHKILESAVESFVDHVLERGKTISKT